MKGCFVISSIHVYICGVRRCLRALKVHDLAIPRDSDVRHVILLFQRSGRQLPVRSTSVQRCTDLPIDESQRRLLHARHAIALGAGLVPCAVPPTSSSTFTDAYTRVGISLGYDALFRSPRYGVPGPQLLRERPQCRVASMMLQSMRQIRKQRQPWRLIARQGKRHADSLRKTKVAGMFRRAERIEHEELTSAHLAARLEGDVMRVGDVRKRVEPEAEARKEGARGAAVPVPHWQGHDLEGLAARGAQRKAGRRRDVERLGRVDDMEAQSTD